MSDLHDVTGEKTLAAAQINATLFGKHLTIAPKSAGLSQGALAERAWTPNELQPSRLAWF